MTGPSRSSVWVRLAMHAYPPRWRAARESELLDVLHDTVPDRPRWPGTDTLLDLVVGGLRTRWRTRPPLRKWLGYRLLNRRLPAACRGWADDDINGRWWWLRRNVPVYVLLLLVFVGPGLHQQRFSLIDAPVLAAIVVLTSLIFARRDRRRAAARHLEIGPTSVPTWVWLNVGSPAPPRTRLTTFLAPVGAVLMLGAPFAAWALLEAQLGSTGLLLAAAAAVGVVTLIAGLFTARARVTRRLATRQPGAMPPRRLPTATVLVLALWLAGAEAAIVLAQRADVIPGIVTLALVAAGVGLGPMLIVLGVIARRSERALGLDVTWRDCRLAAIGSDDAIAPEFGGYKKMARIVATTTDQSAGVTG